MALLRGWTDTRPPYCTSHNGVDLLFLTTQVKPVLAPKSLNAFKSFRPIPASDDAQVRWWLELPPRPPSPLAYDLSHILMFSYDLKGVLLLTTYY